MMNYHKKKMLSFIAFLTLSHGAFALELKIVKDYAQAETEAVWNRARTDVVPETLLGIESVAKPNNPYSQLFPKSFLQEEMYVVCYQECGGKDRLKLRGNNITNSNDWNVVEQSNVYYWTSKFFNYLNEELGFKPNQYLKIMTNRDVKDEIGGKTQLNNAFFNPMDVSLSFLPASKNIFMKMMGGKISRSGFDPSVIAHEASHYIFHHLFPNPVNSEIGGLNEGFADYLANVFLDNPKVGLVMLHGKVLRDSSSSVDGSKNFKSYKPKMPVHDLGERVAYALWTIRKSVADKREMDRLVIDAIVDLGRNPYSTVHDFKFKMLERLPYILTSQQMVDAESIFELTLGGETIQIDNLDFLKKERDPKEFLGFQKTQILNANSAAQMGVDQSETQNFIILTSAKISETQGAVLIANEAESLTTPYWIAIDLVRSNVLGIYSLSGDLITDEQELKVVSPLAAYAIDGADFITDFSDKINTFTQIAGGKGELGLVYRVRRTQTTAHTMIFNGLPIQGQKIEVNLRRRFIIGAVLGVPPIESVTLYTLPLSDIKLPSAGGQTVVGYRLTFETGTAVEVILNKHADAK